MVGFKECRWQKEAKKRDKRKTRGEKFKQVVSSAGERKVGRKKRKTV